MSVEYECSIGLPREYAHDFLLEMKARYPDEICVNAQDMAAMYNIFYLTANYVVVTIAGNHMNDSNIWKAMLQWCQDHLEEDVWQAEELCTEYLAVGGCNCDIFYTTATPVCPFKEYRTLDDLFTAMKETTDPTDEDDTEYPWDYGKHFE